MKKTIMMAGLALAISFGSVSCKKKVSDADLTTKATEMVTTNPNASVEVKEGVAHLSGTFATAEERDAMIAQLEGIEGVKEVMDMTEIVAAAPVEVNEVDPAVLQSVTDAVKDFPSVKVEVVDGALTLTGDVSATQARKIKESVDALKVGAYNNNLVVK